MAADEREESERARRARINHEATQPFFVPGYDGHWPAAVLFAATLVGLTMLWSCLPTALAMFAGGATGATEGGPAVAFFALYAAMAVGPIAGWILWGSRRRWSAMAAVVMFAACVAWLAPSATW